MIQDQIEANANYERTVDEIELALMNAPVDTDDKVCALIEAMCRVMAEHEILPNTAFFHRIAVWVPRRVATILVDGAEHG
jgi:hypothetical protein